MSNVKLQGGYTAPTKIDSNGWITDPTVPDPDNLPEPLGWTLLVRPYPITSSKKSSILMPESDIDYMNYVSNIARVVAVGPCCWNRMEHRDENGENKPWVQVGDFVSYPKNSGSRRKFKGVSYVLLMDDEVVERLPDPQVFDDDFYALDIPEDHLKKYNTIYKKEK
jgi:co-chaperonin GroES (HSP10)